MTEEMNVDIYYSEEEVHAAFANHYLDVSKESDVYVFSKWTDPLSNYANYPHVKLYQAGGILEKILTLFTGKNEFTNIFTALNLSKYEQQKYKKIIDNGGTIIISPSPKNHLASNRIKSTNPDAEKRNPFTSNEQDEPLATPITTEDDPLFAAKEADTFLTEDEKKLLDQENTIESIKNSQQNTLKKHSTEKQLNDVQSKSTALLFEEVSSEENATLTQHFNSDETTSTFDAISSRNIRSNDSKNIQFETSLQFEDNESQLLESDEREEESFDVPFDEENIAHLHNEAIGKASENRRHDLP